MPLILSPWSKNVHPAQAELADEAGAPGYMLLGGKYKHILQLLPEVEFEGMQTGFTKN